jgi:hypothetical protein
MSVGQKKGNQVNSPWHSDAACQSSPEQVFRTPVWGWKKVNTFTNVRYIFFQCQNEKSFLQTATVLKRRFDDWADKLKHKPNKF